MGPDDIARMKKLVRMGDKAPRFFRIHLEALRRNRDWKPPQNYAYYANPFGHPHPAVLARLEALGPRLDSTADDGALEYRLLNDGRLVRMADEVILVSQPVISSIRNASDAIRILDSLGFDLDRLRLVLVDATFATCVSGAGSLKLIFALRPQGAMREHADDDRRRAEQI